MMKIFDYFKRLKERNFEGREPEDKSKNDKAFAAIIVVYILIVVISSAAGFFDINNVFDARSVSDIRINVSDLIILGVILLAYLVTMIRRNLK